MEVVDLCCKALPIHHFTCGNVYANMNHHLFMHLTRNDELILQFDGWWERPWDKTESSIRNPNIKLRKSRMTLHAQIEFFYYHCFIYLYCGIKRNCNVPNTPMWLKSSASLPVQSSDLIWCNPRTKDAQSLLIQIVLSVMSHVLAHGFYSVFFFNFSIN